MPSVSSIVLAPEEPFFTFKVDGKVEKIFARDILYVEGLREYVRIITPSRQYVTYESMKNMEDMLPASDFLRVHKSFIVSKHKVNALDGNQLEIGKVKIPISREKKDTVVAAIFKH